MSSLDSNQERHYCFAVKPINSAVAITDKGRTLPLFHYEALVLQREACPHLPPTDVTRKLILEAAERQFLKNTRLDGIAKTRVFEPSGISNCHGWIFASGNFAISDAFVPLILEDNGYASVTEPQGGDIVVIHNGSEIIHSGIVRNRERGAFLMESKWGPLGVYLHGPEAHPFSGNVAFYRSARAGHLLTIAPTNA
jgi:hypothetical protein